LADDAASDAGASTTGLIWQPARKRSLRPFPRGREDGIRLEQLFEVNVMPSRHLSRKVDEVPISAAKGLEDAS